MARIAGSQRQSRFLICWARSRTSEIWWIRNQTATPVISQTATRRALTRSTCAYWGSGLPVTRRTSSWSGLPLPGRASTALRVAVLRAAGWT